MDKRPAGISIIAFIYVLIACVGLFSSISMSTGNWFATVSMLLLGAAGVGFFIGKQWAWWIIGAMTLFSITTNLIQLLVVINHSGPVSNIQKYYLLIGGKVIVQSLILFFIFSAPVIKFFNFENITKAKLFLYLIAAVAGLFLMLYMF